MAKAATSDPSLSDSDGDVLHVGHSSCGDVKSEQETDPQKDYLESNWGEFQKQLKSAKITGNASVAHAAQMLIREHTKNNGNNAVLEEMFGLSRKGMMDDSARSSAGPSQKDNAPIPSSSEWLNRKFSAPPSATESIRSCGNMKRFTALPLNMASSSALNPSGHSGKVKADNQTSTLDHIMRASSLQTPSNADGFASYVERSSNLLSVTDHGPVKRSSSNLALNNLTFELTQTLRGWKSAATPSTPPHSTSRRGLQPLTPPQSAQRESENTTSLSVLSSASKFLSLRRNTKRECGDEPNVRDSGSVETFDCTKQRQGEILLEDFGPRRSSMDTLGQHPRQSLITKTRRISLEMLNDKHSPFMAATHVPIISNLTNRRGSWKALLPEVEYPNEMNLLEHERQESVSSAIKLFPARAHLQNVESSFIDGLLILAPNRKSSILRLGSSNDTIDCESDGETTISSHSFKSSISDHEVNFRQPRASCEAQALLEEFPTGFRNRSSSTHDAT